MGVSNSTSSSAILQSSLKAIKKKTAVSVNNLANESVPGYARQEVYLETLNMPTPSGVIAGKVLQTINEALIDSLRTEHSKLGSLEAINAGLAAFQKSWGTIGSEDSIAHAFGRLKTSLTSLINGGSIDTDKSRVINELNDVAVCLNRLSDLVQKTQLDFDSMINKNVSKVNALTQDIADLNFRIKETEMGQQNALGLHNVRRQKIHELTELVDVNVRVSENGMLNLDIAGSQTLVNGTNVALLSHTAAGSVTPGVSLPDVLLGGKIITSVITGGRIHGSLYMRDSAMPDLQAEFDELAFQLRDQLNAIHNQGASVNAPNSLTGTNTVPGLGGASLALGTVLEGTGIVRVGSFDKTTRQFVDFREVDLSTLGPTFSVTTLIQALNGGVGAGDASFDVQLTANDQLQITVDTPTNGIAIGTVTGSSPQIRLNGSASGTYYGFSHFFGLNNLLETGTSIAEDSRDGVSNVLRVRSDILTDSKLLANGKLAETVYILAADGTPATVPTDAVIATRDFSLTESMYNIFQTKIVNFTAAGDLSALKTDFIDYAAKIIHTFNTEAQLKFEEVKEQKSAYTELATTAKKVDGVDIREEFMKLIELQMQQALTVKALMILSEMMKQLWQLSK